MMARNEKSRYDFNFKKSLKKTSQYPIISHIKVDRYINRPLATLVVRALLNTPVTANQVTVAGFFIGMAAAFLYLGASHGYYIAAGILIQVSSVLDGADGMLARLRNTCSDYGSFLDLFLDRINDYFLFCGIIFGNYLATRNFKFLVFCLLCLALYFLQINLYYLTKFFKKDYKSGQAAESRALVLFMVFILSLANQLTLLLILLAMIPIGSTLVKVINLIRYRRD
ncbi:MAG: CDP-alcohol phosphatidyltransferase family protein [Candidatus Aminicenantes bacterium]|nr:CDP-alcohol phosphatidyltransferase family protein [Candidatus Aminicenantes bacterium]